MSDAPPLTVGQAAVCLGMTPQGVRKAVREGRLAGTAKLLPSGKREYGISAAAIEAYLARGAPDAETDAEAEADFRSQFETLSYRYELTSRDLHARELEVATLKARLEAVERDLMKTKKALYKVVRAFTRAEETQPRTAGGTP